MTRTLIRLGIAALVGGALFLACSPAMSTGGDQPGHTPAIAVTRSTAERTVAASVTHRVVWDQFRQGRSGIHLRSANRDGTHIRRVYDAPAGFTTQLTLSRDGRRVAFATCCRKSFPPMVVVPTRGGPTLRPLAHHPEIYAVGGIGWSPDGTRLAFEGTVATRHRAITSLWTVRTDGTRLRRVVRLTTAGSFINPALAWTRAGILYSDGNDLRSARSGTTHLVLRHVDIVRISGDGRHIITRRETSNGYSFWAGHPDGTDQHRFLATGPPGEETFFAEVTPSFDGMSVLAFRETPNGNTGDTDQVVTWTLGDDPSSARVLKFLGSNSTVTWN